MNKKQLAGKVANKVDVTKAFAEEMIDAILGTITEVLKGGDKIRLVGFGNFVVRTRKGRIGRNPQTGEKITIGSSKSPAFVPGINLKGTIKGK
ncbi:MAG: HU family DNA-binding protein [Candidatus Margulisiibacteriota bacterium]